MQRSDMMTGQYEPVRRLLLRLDRQLQMRLFDRIAAGDPDPDAEPAGSAVAPVTGMLLDLLAGRRQEHARRLWTDWFEPVIQRDLRPLAASRRLPGCVHVLDVSACWLALSRAMMATVADIQYRAAAMARHMPLDRVLVSEEALAWAETLRRASLAELQAMRRSPARLAAFLSVVNAERAGLTARLVPVARAFEAADLQDIAAVLEHAPALRAFRRNAGTLAPDVLQAELARALESGTVALEAVALYAAAGLHARGEPSLAARLSALLPLPLVEEAASVCRRESSAEPGGMEADGAPVGSAVARCGSTPAGDAPLSPEEAALVGRSLARIAEALSGTTPFRR
ncbi:hypothetical protein [Azospirillum sp. SYSU D00513]|uniref:hypothetical protein n=1 Tax=Azospirillum sp. SYSU D00513 TaxID=2812561 RepID=UPI001A95D547|nr:hypothetical protein [Azospirillum sp. SYSU D00513]